MDSSNSGSFQSSSGGAGGGTGGGGGGDNEEYDSRTQSISSFLNPSNHFNPNLNHLLQQQPPSHHHPPPTNTTNTFFNPSSSPFSPNPNPVHQDLSSIWAGSSLPYPTNPNPNLNPTSMDTNINTKTGHGSDHNLNQVGVMTKNPKKRTRASRRAPTTVLTTDTTNFRQMVQEFTGIPTAPFTTAGPFSRRLDLFNPLRPSVQKIQHAPPYLNTTHNMVENSTTTSNYNLAPSTIHDFPKQPSTLLDLQNPMLSFQSLLQQNNVSQQGNELGGFPSSSKRWRSENDKMENFEGVIGNNQNIGGSKLNSGLENVGDQVQGNEGSWICPSS